MERKAVGYFDPLNFFLREDYMSLPDDVQETIDRMSPWQSEFDLLYLGKLYDTALIITKDEDGNYEAFLYGIWRGDPSAMEEVGIIDRGNSEKVRELFEKHAEESDEEERKKIEAEILKHLHVKHPEDLEFEGSGVSYPVVFRVDTYEEWVADWEYEGKEAKEFREKAYKEVA